MILDNEIEEYNRYLTAVRERIKFLNKKIGKKVELDHIDLPTIKKLNNEEWGFVYKINLCKNFTKGAMNGTIRFKSFDLWVAKKKADDREQKLKKLGL